MVLPPEKNNKPWHAIATQTMETDLLPTVISHRAL